MLKGPLQSGTLKTSKNGYFCTFYEHKNVFVGLLYDGYKQAFETKTMIFMNSKRDTKQKGWKMTYTTIPQRLEIITKASYIPKYNRQT